MTETNNTRVPGRDEPDPKNIRQRGFQGGTDSLSEPPTTDQTYGQMRYADGEGPFADVRLPNGAGSGLSGLPQANAGTVPPLYNDPKSPEGPGEQPNDERV
jgi:hypothetical protein